MKNDQSAEVIEANMEHNDSNMDIDPYVDTDSEAKDMKKMYIKNLNIDSINFAR